MHTVKKSIPVTLLIDFKNTQGSRYRYVPITRQLLYRYKEGPRGPRYSYKQWSHYPYLGKRGLVIHTIKDVRIDFATDNESKREVLVNGTCTDNEALVYSSLLRH